MGLDANVLPLHLNRGQSASSLAYNSKIGYVGSTSTLHLKVKWYFKCLWRVGKAVF